MILLIVAIIITRCGGNGIERQATTWTQPLSFLCTFMPELKRHLNEDFDQRGYGYLVHSVF